MNRRPKTASKRKEQANEPPQITPEDEKTIKELQKLIFKQEQLLRGTNLEFK